MTLKQAVIAALLPPIVASGSARAATIHVPSEQSTVQAGLDAAAAGDTVLVAPGRYKEHIVVPVGVVLRSSDGPDSTVLVSAELTGDPLTERLLEVAKGADRSTEIVGFSLDPAGCAGTGIFCEDASPTIRGNRFLEGFGFGLNVRMGNPLVEENDFAGCVTFGILVFAASPEIVRNQLHDCMPRAIEVTGVKSQPVIGGRPGQENRFYSNALDIVNSSTNTIDATYNDWGWATTAEMESHPWPADIGSITDANDQGRSHRGRGVVDYRNWVRGDNPAGAAPRNRWLLPILVVVGLALLIVVVVRR